MEKRCHRGAIPLVLNLWKALEADLRCAPRERVDIAEDCFQHNRKENFLRIQVYQKWTRQPCKQQLP